MATINEKMTALADKIRSLTGQTGKLSLDAMDTEVQEANEDKENMITALEELGITIDANASLSDIANMLPNVEAGTDTSDATAEAGDILKGETAYVDGEKIIGTMTNNGTISKTMDGINTKSVAVPAGYTSGGTVSLTDDIDNEVDTQADLISQITTALEGKAAGSAPTLQEKTITPSTSTQTVTPDSGYDGLNKVTVNAMPTATQATPSITISSSGLITASATQTAGYVSAGTKSGTKQLTTQAAKTITPSTSSQTAVAKNVYTTGAITVAAIPSTYVKPTSTKAATTYTPTTSNQTIASGTYCSGAQTIKGDANLVPANIAEGVSIFGVTGTHSGGSGGGGAAETCTITIMAEAPVGNSTFYYADVSGTMCTQTASGMDMMTGGITITCMKNSFIYAYMTFGNVSGATFQNITRIDNNCIFVSGDATYTIM